MAKILIIEDSEAQAQILSDIVEECGHEAVVCRDFARGIAQTIKGVNPDAVLLDLVLLGPEGKPVGDGFQFCREIKRVSKQRIKVVIVSAKNDDESTEWAMLQGADAFLQKPFAVEDLVKVIGELLPAGTREN